MTVVVLDANVLYPAALRDTLLRAADADLYSARWSEEILDEMARNLRKRGRSSDQVQGLLDEMAANFPDANVIGYEHWLSSMTNDPKDRHVLAAAVEAGARVIVTSNLRHFPLPALAPLRITAQSPDTFLRQLFDQDAKAIVRIIKEQALDLHRPPKTPSDILDMLTKHAPTFVALVHARLG